MLPREEHDKKMCYDLKAQVQQKGQWMIHIYWLFNQVGSHNYTQPCMPFFSDLPHARRSFWSDE